MSSGEPVVGWVQLPWESYATMGTHTLIFRCPVGGLIWDPLSKSTATGTLLKFLNAAREAIPACRD